MKTLAWIVLILTGLFLGVVLAFTVLWMIYIVATNAEGAGMAGITLLMGIAGGFFWALKKINKKAP